ncbi:MAG: hypothetical protein IPM26_08480 [Saprospiraceae bacterium]|nr:hypothetical protein [Saprospiraceae bacterium]
MRQNITYNHLNLPVTGTGGERGCSSHTKWLVAEVKRSYRPATRCKIGRGAISGVKTLCATAKVLLREITNTYDASGRKWQSTVGGVTTTYFGDIEYEGNAIKMIYHEDGRIERLTNGT